MKNSSEDKLYPMLILFFVIIAIWVVSIWLIMTYLQSWNDRGTFGDMFGAINSLFSGLALAGIIYTILLQRNELALQRQELIETRKELARSASAQERSESELRRQVEHLKTTATLNALGILINYYNDREEKFMGGNASIVHEAREKRNIYLHQIESILKSTND